MPRTFVDDVGIGGRAGARRVYVFLSLAICVCAGAVECSAQQRRAESGTLAVSFGDVRLFGGGVVHAATSPLRWSASDVRRLAGGVVMLGALSSADDAGRSLMRRNRSDGLSSAAREIERLGTIENYAVLGGFWVVGVVTGDDRARHVAAEGLASSVVAAALITPSLQRIAGRVRPRHDALPHTFHAFSGNISFPSGHTTQAFAVASVIATEYPHPLVQVAAYGAAAGVAASRMYHDAHFASDVVAAALIGTVVGRAVARYGQARRE